MQKEFTPYEQALSLKELGFDEPCFATYKKDATASKKPFEYDIDYHTKVEMHHSIPVNSEYINDWISAPTFSQAFRFFREKEFYCIVYKYHDGFAYEVYGEGLQIIKEPFNTYEEAELACIIKLIDIVKKQTLKV